MRPDISHPFQGPGGGVWGEAAQGGSAGVEGAAFGPSVCDPPGHPPRQNRNLYHMRLEGWRRRGWRGFTWGGAFPEGERGFLMGRKETVGLCLVGRGICVFRINPRKQEFLSAFLLNSTYHLLTLHIYIFTRMIVYLSQLEKVPRGEMLACFDHH